VVRAGRRLTIVAVELLAADGTLVATATGAFCPTGKPLPPPGVQPS
jgi:acyl-coenzyme A thioesterase PaaI-like protein